MENAHLFLEIERFSHLLLGRLGIEIGFFHYRHLLESLNIQCQTPEKKLGQILREKGFINGEQLSLLLRYQAVFKNKSPLEWPFLPDSVIKGILYFSEQGDIFEGEEVYQAEEIRKKYLAEGKSKKFIDILREDMNLLSPSEWNEFHKKINASSWYCSSCQRVYRLFNYDSSPLACQICPEVELQFHFSKQKIVTARLSMEEILQKTGQIPKMKLEPERKKSTSPSEKEADLELPPGDKDFYLRATPELLNFYSALTSYDDEISESRIAMVSLVSKEHEKKKNVVNTLPEPPLEKLIKTSSDWQDVYEELEETAERKIEIRRETSKAPLSPLEKIFSYAATIVLFLFLGMSFWSIRPSFPPSFQAKFAFPEKAFQPIAPISRIDAKPESEKFFLQARFTKPEKIELTGRLPQAQMKLSLESASREIFFEKEVRTHQSFSYTITVPQISRQYWIYLESPSLEKFSCQIPYPTKYIQQTYLLNQKKRFTTMTLALEKHILKFLLSKNKERLKKDLLLWEEEFAQRILFPLDQKDKKEFSSTQLQNLAKTILDLESKISDYLLYRPGIKIKSTKLFPLIEQSQALHFLKSIFRWKEEIWGREEVVFFTKISFSKGK